MNDYKELIERLLYYGTEYTIGDNLGREIDGTGELLLETKDAIETLTSELAEERHRHDRLQDWDRGMTEKLASAELQCKQVNEGAAILTKRLSDSLEELERAKKRIAELEGEREAD